MEGKENSLHVSECGGGHSASTYSTKMEKKMKFPFYSKMYSGGLRRENKQLWRKTIAEVCIRQSADQGQSGFNQPHMKQINTAMCVY